MPMGKKSDEYWQKRFEILQEALLNKGDKYYVELIKQYEKASKNIQDKITLWYIRLMDNNDISLARAKQILSRKELKEFKWTVEEYIRYGKENAINQQWIKELENASARVHISKLEAMQIEIQQQVETLAKMQEIKVPELLQETYTEGYYQTAYEVQKGLNTGWDIQKLDTSTVEKVMSKPWTVDNKTFSDRIWSNKEQLIDTLNKELTQSIIRGDAPDKLIKTIADKFDTSKKVAGRLVMTESAYFSSLSRSDSYEELGVKKYKIVATLDLKTSAICRSLDNKIFNLSEYKVNVTAPPFHVHCRTTTAPYIEGLDDILTGQRAARDPITGKTTYVDDKMTYPEWYEKYVKGNPQAELNEKKLKNAGADQKQYDNYKNVLGKEAPKSLDDFRNLKYNDIEKWEGIKRDYRYANMLKNRKIVIRDENNRTLPLEGDPYTITDFVDDNRVKQRRLYGSNRKAMKDIDTSDHGKPKYHPMGAHKHDYDYEKEKPHGKADYFTEEELRQNKDIIRKGDNYNDYRNK